jgi:hypothetical protein|tara:strand:- start:313 stop:972 length:660 start_codon:yes stop_codon:yes gene_type:complete
MKPRYEEMSYETTVLFEKAHQLSSRLNLLEKASMAEKDKYCMKNFGKKYSECSEKQKAQCDKAHGKVEKGKDCPDCKNNDCPTCKMEKAEKCPSCGEKMEKGACMKMGCGGKMEKAEKCPSCGGKMEKGACMKMGCGGKMAKAQPGFKPEKITDVNPHFVAESGGQTKSGYFTTNGRTIETEDAKPKKKKLESKFNMERLSSRQNPHSDTGVVREEQFD